MSYKWSFMREMHAYIANKEFLIAGNPDRPNLPSFFFYTAPVNVLISILDDLSTDSLIAWLQSDNLLAYRFLNGAWPSEADRSNRSALMNRNVLRPIPDVMLLLLEREFGITGNRTKMLCLPQFRETLANDFKSWSDTVDVSGVKSLFDRMFFGPAFPRWVLPVGGVVFQHSTDDALYFTSLVKYASAIEPVDFEAVLDEQLGTFRGADSYAPIELRISEHYPSVRGIVTMVVASKGNKRITHRLVDDFPEGVIATDIQHKFSASVYDKQRIDAGAFGSSAYSFETMKFYASATQPPTELFLGLYAAYCDYECCVWKSDPATALVTILYRFVPDAETVAGTEEISSPGLLRFKKHPTTTNDTKVLRLDRLRHSDRFGLAIIYGISGADNNMIDIISTQADGEMYVSKRYSLPPILYRLPVGASQNVVRFETPSSIWFLDTDTGKLTQYTAGNFPLKLRAPRVDQMHLFDMPPDAPPSVTTLENLISVSTTAMPTTGERKRKDGGDSSTPPRAFLRDKTKI
jgi:hypothetical protein